MSWLVLRIHLSSFSSIWPISNSSFGSYSSSESIPSPDLGTIGKSLKTDKLRILNKNIPHLKQENFVRITTLEGFDEGSLVSWQFPKLFSNLFNLLCRFANFYRPINALASDRLSFELTTSPGRKATRSNHHQLSSCHTVPLELVKSVRPLLSHHFWSKFSCHFSLLALS